MGSWDRGANYQQTKEKILMILSREKDETDINRHRRLAYCCIALIQLTNGSRSSEAHDAWLEWMFGGEREVMILVRKHELPEDRLMIIPQELTENDRIKSSLDYETVSLAGYKMWAKRKLVNTHSLRYSFIGHMAELKEQPQVIAKITHHVSLDQILNYTQQNVADDTLRKLHRKQ